MAISKIQSKINVKYSILRFAILTLFILIIFICYDLIFASWNNNELFHENVSFDRMNLDRTSSFTVKQEGKAIVHVFSDIEEGGFHVALYNPEGYTVYEYEGLKGSDDKEIEIYKGDWTVKIIGGDVKKGKYKVLIQRIRE
ncbi:hypothetical protein [Proteiniborus sp. MB09-C3]|uniref:hypothetical protein n=1 Tax=Proteiniborus sp. MB09-C3 TaxID=3050072 RepID=UPI0025550E6E|nr:hypothetical protein [Proteiniborus sp. MB09-C3]WIV10585.1 hypothetical protein QO263_10490 [Proteiniborus sp. MB09-C3]